VVRFVAALMNLILKIISSDLTYAIEQSPGTRQALEADRLSCEAAEVQLKATVEGFVGLFLIQYHGLRGVVHNADLS
jgi:hypothetical protein